MEETLRTNLLELCELHRGATGLSSGAIGNAALRDHTFFARLEKGDSGFNVRTYDRAIQWFVINWRGDVVWPTHIQRPEAPSATDSRPEPAGASS